VILALFILIVLWPLFIAEMNLLTFGLFILLSFVFTVMITRMEKSQ
jgi:hypothetical protein